jgi:hypothetical protein
MLKRCSAPDRSKDRPTHNQAHYLLSKPDNSLPLWKYGIMKLHVDNNTSYLNTVLRSDMIETKRNIKPYDVDYKLIEAAA